MSEGTQANKKRGARKKEGVKFADKDEQMTECAQNAKKSEEKAARE